MIIHLAGSFDEDTGQFCVVCSMYMSAPDEGEWNEGASILVLEDGLCYDLEYVPHWQEKFPEAQHCQPEEYL